MNTPERIFLGWDSPAIELVAAKLLDGLSIPDTAAQYRRATVVVPTAESGRRLREYMAEKAGKSLLMPKITLAGQLIPTEGENTLSETEELTVWLRVIEAISQDALNQYAPLIPYRPEVHVEKWAVGVAHKLMALRNRMEQEGITYHYVTGQLAKMETGISNTLASLPEEEEHANQRRTLASQRTVLQNEQKRWVTLGRVLREADALAKTLFPSKTLPSEVRKKKLENIAWPGQCRLIILACVPELSTQLQHYLSRLHGLDGGEVQIWVHAHEDEKPHFDTFGRPMEEDWTEREIRIPNAFVYPGNDPDNVDNEASTIHLVNDAEAMAEEALRLAGGCTSREAVLAVCDDDFSPALLNTFADAGWQLNMPEGRSAMSTDLGRLASQLADACDARENLPLWSDEDEAVTNNGTQGLEAFAALLCNTALQQAWADDVQALTGLQEHVENIRMLLLPGSERALLQMLKNLPTVSKGYKSIEKLQKGHSDAYFSYADKVSRLITALCSEKQASQLEILAKALEAKHTEGSAKPLARSIARQMKACAMQGDKLPSRLCTMELLRRRVEDKVRGPALSERNFSVGDILGWRELAYTRERQVILAAMHDGCIPEPVPEDDFLPESLCQELGIRHEKFRIARDSYLLTALIHSRSEQGGRVDFILARQKEDGSVLAPSSLLMRCGNELPRRARTLFAESKTPKTLPAVPRCPLRRATGGLGAITPGILESIEQISGGRQNPYTRPIEDENGNTMLKTFSPSSLATFLQCPLTFWIKNLLNIDLGNSYKENKGELESNEYGTVMHAVLDELVKQFPSEERLLQACPAAETDTATGIDHMLQKGREIARMEWQRVYNSTTTRNRQPLAMEIQLQAIERSLQAFVTQHLQDLKDGWCNIVREYTFEPRLEYAEGQFAGFYMNADRIDRNKDGRWRIIDYKTSSSEKKPHKVHFDVLDKGADSLYCRFMNVQGYEFGTVCFGEKMYRWSDVQLPLYAYGLRHPSAKDRKELEIPAHADMTAVVPDLVYYNLQSKTEKLVPFYLIKDGEVQPISNKVREVPETEELLESAMKTVKSSIGMIRRGQCLFSAESLELKSKPYSVLVSPGSNTPRFGALSLQNDPRSLFALPSLVK
ncbi:MAG: PD-(D/E)XK nuclease family protein [Akkermansia sp.]|nr:PD-(D/E)XK nuclease family protein [Akkermansia sp.]